MRWGALVGLALAASCGGGDARGIDGAAAADGPAPDAATLPPTDPAALRTTLDDLAAFGEKKVGTAAGAQAGDYVRDRMTAIGLADVHFEEFRFPRHDVGGSSLVISFDGVADDTPAPYEVLGGSGPGDVTTDVVWAGSATSEELVNVSVAGKIALVRRAVTFHRSAQYRNLVQHGAAAMLYVSSADGNLRQVGQTGFDWEPIGAIPAISIGNDDGTALRDALDAGAAVTAHLTVEASVTPATGRNVVGRVAGSDPSGEFVVGAHYDTWFTGSTDNGGGVAALLALADRVRRHGQPRYGVVFVAYDGEEVGLYGGYHYLRKHTVDAADPILWFVNFEVPSARDTSFFGLGRSSEPILDDALRAGGLNFIYPLYVDLSVVPGFFGGIIPTDIQGMYRANIATVTTACDTPYYHTDQDTPEKVDAELLAQAVDGFDQALGVAMAADRAAFAIDDPKLWKTEVEVTQEAGGPVMATVHVVDAAGAPQAGAEVAATLLYDDFTLARELPALTGDDGSATIAFSADDAALGDGGRYLHVTAGIDYPLVERIFAIE